MSRLDAVKVRMFRTDSAGRTIYVPKFRQDVYLIRDPSEATRVATAVTSSRATLLLALAFAIVTSSTHPVLALAMFVVAMWSAISRRRVLATLEKSTERAQDLPPVDRDARRRAYCIAMGRRYFRDQIAASMVIPAVFALGFYTLRDVTAHGRSTGWPPVSVTIVGAVILAFCIFGLVSSIVALRLIPPDAPAAPLPG